MLTEQHFSFLAHHFHVWPSPFSCLHVYGKTCRFLYQTKMEACAFAAWFCYLLTSRCVGVYSRAGLHIQTSLTTRVISCVIPFSVKTTSSHNIFQVLRTTLSKLKRHYPIANMTSKLIKDVSIHRWDVVSRWTLIDLLADDAWASSA